MEKELPILIYKGDTVCYNVLNTFAEEFGTALTDLGENVEYYDLGKYDLTRIGECAGRKYKAVVGFQSYLFDLYLPNAGKYLHDLMEGPKFNFQFDHPVWMRNHYEKLPGNCYILTHDRNYKKFIETYYPKVTGTYILPPGGMEADVGSREEDGNRNADGSKKTDSNRETEKIYDMVFVGTYTDYRDYEAMIETCDAGTKAIAAAFFHEMIVHPNQTAEKSLEQSLQDQKIHCEGAEFLGVLDGLKPLIYGAMSYYREQTVATLLKAGRTIEVYGDSWKKSPFAGNVNLHIHEAVTPEESLLELQKSRYSLNVMAWHKDGFTERIANSMLNHAVVVTDQSDYLREHFVDGEELILFDLEKLEELSQKLGKQGVDLRELHIAEIAEKAHEKAVKELTWKSRAEEFLRILEEQR